jgi:hypothetical protein
MHVETPYCAVVNDVHLFFSCITDLSDLLEEHMDACKHQFPLLKHVEFHEGNVA